MAKNKYDNISLDWAEKQLLTWQAYVDEHPYDEAKDRITLKETKNGGLIPVTCATIESIHKDLRETVKEYLTLLEVVKKLRAETGSKDAETYGDTGVSPRMKIYEGRQE